MERRKNQRFPINLEVWLGKRIADVQDISVGGMRLAVDILPKTRKVQVTIDIDGKSVDLIGNIRWIQRIDSHTKANILGVAIERPPRGYIRWVERLISKQGQGDQASI